MMIGLYTLTSAVFLNNNDTKLVHDWYVPFRHLLKAQPKFALLFVGAHCLHTIVSGKS